MNLWIITVNFGNTSVTDSLINSISDIETLDSIKIGIADNSASFESAAALNQIIKNTELDIKIFSYKKNLYYWPAVKKIINNLKNIVGSYPDWAIICNNDITFSDKNFFEKLEKIDPKQYPIIGPKIVNSDGNDLNPFMIKPLSRIQKFYWNLYFVSFSISKIFLRAKKIINIFSQKRRLKSITNKKEVYAVHGSAIIFSNHFFHKGGWFDDNFEMYGEELTVAEIAKNLNLPVTYIPQLRISHHEHSSTRMIDQESLFIKARKAYKYFKSKYQI